MPPLFSVIIPAYNQAEFLDEAVQSILNQTVQDFEILVVNDASTDGTAEIMSRYNDPRIITLTHPENRGLPSARNTGMAVSRGEFIALLDADDYYHPHKFEAHLHFLRAHPEISVTYNARFELHHSSKKIRDVYRPPATAELKDLVSSFPFSPSDMVIRREAAASIHFFDENMRCGGEDLDFPCRLALEGYRFARVSGVLNYRRFHAGRRKKKLRCRFGDYTRALDAVFKDPRCPVDVVALRAQACANHYTEIACWALAQGETELGNEIIQEILLLNPKAGSGSPSRLAISLFNHTIRDESIDHEKVLPELYKRLPAALAVPADAVDALVARGYLLKGTRSALWGDGASAEKYFTCATALGAGTDIPYCMMVAAQLAVYDGELGAEVAACMAQQLYAYLNKYYGPACARQIQGYFSSERAFNSYHQGDYSATLQAVSRTISSDPRYLANRGILSIIIRSFWKSVKNRLS